MWDCIICWLIVVRLSELLMFLCVVLWCWWCCFCWWLLVFIVVGLSFMGLVVDVVLY